MASFPVDREPLGYLMLIVNPAYPEVSESWFDPTRWGERARLVSAGGRGSAWFVNAPYGDMVLRHYRRGGMAARLSERRYIFTGWQRTRSSREYRLLKELYNLGLPVPEPIAAHAVRYGILYEAAILIRRIPDAVPLPEVGNLSDKALWQKVGRVIRRFHDAGLDHVDLNCDNILVSGDEVYVIDFDRCRVTETRLPEAQAKSNLSRFNRSVEKRLAGIPDYQRAAWIAAVEDGYRFHTSQAGPSSPHS